MNKKSDELSTLHTDSNLESSVASFCLGMFIMCVLLKGPLSMIVILFPLSTLLYWIAYDRHKTFHTTLMSRVRMKKKKS